MNGQEAREYQGDMGLIPNHVFLTHAITPQNLGVLPEPASSGQARGSCGDVIEMYLRVENGRIDTVRFMPRGCLHTIACGSVLTDMIQGVLLEEAASCTAEQVETALGGLPREHRHCATLAVAALKAAIRRHYENLHTPWKRLYMRS